MSKFLKFKSLLVNQDGKREEMGLVFIRADCISMCREIWDKHEVLIPNVTLICEKGNPSGITVEGDIKDIMNMIEEASVYE